ncbi:5-dehydro-2-deoxygluconokinase [Actinoplanes sp. SE50]|uniref:5-dehydro-2-deoxygluconokinase n=1 Tax=unclassified Actinoplanes TaxID=2626549 RepID=UPI00023ECE6C|nr:MULTISPECIES: 5-dehydro-2-deoxygluconokinase [unclassified Actinoplanes]AEV83816.1 5-dehydro-2-deoxygluconokinase [Actinoplanes sp. SE50/110]ATO82040.1 5-dehydro-2-deoxygluconokinase [Actinoplanes sp. SE50]SLL99448.1 5-dehydro-2-deoxygluconokinase [Actinoplanes sp. SE50/110]
MSAHEVLTMGRIGVDLYPEQLGTPLAQVRTFAKSLGGSPTNVAVAAARLGRRAAVITRVGADPFGSYLRDALRRFGVDDRFVGVVEHLPTPVTFCEIFPPDRFPLYFYRYPRAPDLEISPYDVDLAAVRAATIFWVTGTGLSAAPSREATLAALRARGRTGVTVFDLDWRPMLWASPEEARPWYLEALRYATVAIGNVDEVAIAVGGIGGVVAASDGVGGAATAGGDDDLLGRLLATGVELAVLKQGPAGVRAATRTETTYAPAIEVDVVNGLGAGDAFGGALCHGLLAGWPLAETIRFANAAGALVASRLACADAMPTAAEVHELLAAGRAPARLSESPDLPDVDHG